MQKQMFVMAPDKGTEGPFLESSDQHTYTKRHTLLYRKYAHPLSTISVLCCNGQFLPLGGINVSTCHVAVTVYVCVACKYVSVRPKICF